MCRVILCSRHHCEWNIYIYIFAASSGVEHNSLFEKIDFVITDQTAHNFKVDAILAECMDFEHIPEQLFCNVHPDKMYSNFLINVTTTTTSMTDQALDCSTRLINHKFDYKPWNKSNEFDTHIYSRPKKQ